jgi:UPF0716 family protein affecting phage T7 exclusion
VFTPNIDEEGAEARKNGSRVVLFIAAILLFVPGLVYSLRMTVVGFLIILGLFMRFQASKRWCAVRACGIKTSL